MSVVDDPAAADDPNPSRQISGKRMRSSTYPASFMAVTHLQPNRGRGLLGARQNQIDSSSRRWSRLLHGLIVIWYYAGQPRPSAIARTLEFGQTVVERDLGCSPRINPYVLRRQPIPPAERRHLVALLPTRKIA